MVNLKRYLNRLKLPILVFLTTIFALNFLIYLESQGLIGERENPIVKSPVQAAEAHINANEEGFYPKTIVVRRGQTVTWTNDGPNPHQIASDPHPTHDNLPGLESKVLLNGESFTFTFQNEGEFTYHDHLNPFQFQGTVIVK